MGEGGSEGVRVGVRGEVVRDRERQEKLEGR